MTILVLNAGSSSVKFSLFTERDDDLCLLGVELDRKANAAGGPLIRTAHRRVAGFVDSALTQRFASRGEDEFANELLSALRHQFGGHEERR